jgi:hypothetical protein
VKIVFSNKFSSLLLPLCLFFLKGVLRILPLLSQRIYLTSMLLLLSSLGLFSFLELDLQRLNLLKHRLVFGFVNVT